MDNEVRNREIVEYINKLVNDLTVKFPNMNFNNVRDNAISAFTSMNGDFDAIKVQVDASFAKAVQNMNSVQQVNAKEPDSRDSFEMTPEEAAIYQQLKQENLARRNAMGLNNGKKLVLERSNYLSDRGYINFLVIMGIVLVVLVALIVVVCNVLL